MDLNSCKQLLSDQFKKDFTQTDNISKLMSDARAENKNFCYQEFGSTTAIKTYLEQVKKGGGQTTVQGNEKTGSVNTGTISNVVKDQTNKDKTHNLTSTVSKDEGGRIVNKIGQENIDQIKFFGQLILFGRLFAVIAYVFVKYSLRFWYDVSNSRRIRYIKVILTRGDGKSDREQEKEVAKDMKEKISRMSQVLHNMHRLGSLSLYEKFLTKIFYKPKTSLILHYEDGQLIFILGIYPEYQQIIEGAISAQYPNCSIEMIEKPNLFKKKFYDITPMEPLRDSVYNIKIYKNQPDDPMNNVLDSIGKISRYDTLSIIIPIKPIGREFNKKAQKIVEGLYKQDAKYMEDYMGNGGFFSKLFNPIKNLFKLIFFGSPKEGEKNKFGYVEGGTTMVRMVKAQEDYLNSMGEETALPYFKAGMLIVTSSDDKANLEGNIDNVVSAFSTYGDEYGNRLVDCSTKADAFGFIFKPLRKFAAKNFLIGFFFKKNVFGINELTSLFHFPDNTYNRAPIISWMQYKVLPGPENLPILKDENGFVMSGKIAESYKKGDLSDILIDYRKHRAVGRKIIQEEVFIPIEKFSEKELKEKEIVEKDGKQMVKMLKDKEQNGYKMYKDGVLLGINIYRNSYSPVYMKREDRTRHHYCIGKSGTGKSVFLQTIARQDIRNGDGCCVIDPHGDLVEDVLSYIPKERAKDIVYFDAGNEDRPMGLNLYEINNIDEADRTVNDATEIFIKMFGPEIFGPRIQEYFKYGSLTLLEDFEDRPTLLDVVRLFTDEAYREYKTKNIKNPTVRNRREKTYNAMGDREKQEIIPYFSAKFVSFNTNRLIRNIIGQTKSGFNLEDIMNNRKILLINLSKGKIGEINAQLLGMILVSKIYNGAMSRARMPESERKDFYLYVDEFQNFVSGTFADILSEARKYRLCLIMAHQYIAQLEPAKGLGGDQGGKGDVKAAVFGNVGTMQSFKVGAPDAEFLEKEYAPVLSQQDIIGIANYKAYLKLNIDNSTTRVFSMNAIYTKDYQNKKIAEILKEYSAKKYGRKREFVDAEIAARLGMSIDENLLQGQETKTQNNTETQNTENNQVQTPQASENQETQATVNQTEQTPPIQEATTVKE